MLGASRASIEDLRGALDAIYADPSQRDGLAAAGTGVLTVLDAADDERALRDLWADHATPEAVKDGVLEQLIRNGFADAEKRLTAPVQDAAEAPPQPGPALPDGSNEDSLWDKIFGKRPAEISPAVADPSPVQARWGL